MREKTNNILDIIGNTPLVRVPLESEADIFAKLEYLNPGGSIKDRSALFMVEEAEKKGLLKPGGTIIEASSGNQGTALAMIGAVKGYKVIICCADKHSEEKIKTMRAYGAEVIVCDSRLPAEDEDNYHNLPKKLAQKTPGAFLPDQYHNLSNAEAHYHTTGPEIWEQTKGRITHLFVPVGTAGTISGTGKFLKEKNPKIKIIGVDVDVSFRSTGGKPKPYKLEGIGVDEITPVLDESVIDEFITVSDGQSFAMMKVMASKYGLMLGGSGGSVASATLSYLPRLKEADLAVMIFSDSGRAYLSKNYF